MTHIVAPDLETAAGLFAQIGAAARKVPNTFAAIGIAVALVMAVTVAEAAATPTCAEAIRQLENDSRLRVQGGADEQVVERETAKVHLAIAARAAAVGNQKECWRHFHWALVNIR